MRKGSQSMYQPNNKSVAVSKVMGTSAFGLQGKGFAATTRKVEGHDLGKTAKTSFQQTVQHLKSKPAQKGLEDEYINGLQEEIKYLEYELKLLKDKQLLEREGVNQLDNFLKDEIPINQNILAMKNKYNSTKAKLEQQLSSLNLRKGEAEDVLHTQKDQINRLHDIINAHRKQKDQRRAEFKRKLAQIIKQNTIANDQYTSLGDEGRRFNESIKKMNEEISMIQRALEKEKIAEVRAVQDRTKKQQKFEEKYRLTKEQMVETTQRCEELQSLQDKNPLIMPMEDANSQLRKRIMLNEKQKSTAQNNISEIQLFLREEQRDREIQRQHRSKYTAVADDCRIEIQTLDREADNIIKDQTLRSKKIMIKEMTQQLTEKDDIYDLLSDRLRNLEQECSNLIQEKKELQDTLEDQGRLEKDLLQATAAAEQAITRNRSGEDSLRRVTQEIILETDPVKDELEKCKGRIPMVQREIERKNLNIVYLNKQVDLIKELKNLDLQQLHMISQGGSQMQNSLHAFIKNWQKIKQQ